MTDLVEKTNEELIAEIEAVEKQIADLQTDGKARQVPSHELYKSIMWLTCMSCTNRYVDPAGCPVCKPAKDFLQEFREIYPWAADKTRDQLIAEDPTYETRVREAKAKFEAEQRAEFAQQEATLRRKNKGVSAA